MLDTISTIDFDNFKGLDPKFEDVCTLELTVATGLEEGIRVQPWYELTAPADLLSSGQFKHQPHIISLTVRVAAYEIKEKLSVEPLVCRGRVLIDIETSKVAETLSLRSIDHVFILINVKPKFELTDEREKCFLRLYQYATSPDWKKGLSVWQSMFKINVGDPFKDEKPLNEDYCKPRPDLDLRLMKKESPVAVNLPDAVMSSIGAKKDSEQNKEQPEVKENPEIKEDAEEIKNHNGPKFRVSCHRVGSGHKFGSPEAARQFGAGINERFNWKVDLKNFDLEVLLNISEDFVYVSVSLTKEPLFKRNLTYFGPTNLRATICYNMIRLAKPQPGDIIVDPMCGGCTLPMEGALTYKNCFYLGGDNVKQAVTRSQNNIESLSVPLNIDILQWSCVALPLRSQSVDVIISDFPFGKRMGSKGDNRVLYFKSLVELARVTRVKSGRAVLLTHDRNSMSKNLTRVSKLWKNISCRTINIGGLAAGVYILHRTSLLSDPNVFSNAPSVPTFNANENKKRKLDSDT